MKRETDKVEVSNVFNNREDLNYATGEQNGLPQVVLDMSWDISESAVATVREQEVQQLPLKPKSLSHKKPSPDKVDDDDFA